MQGFIFQKSNHGPHIIMQSPFFTWTSLSWMFISFTYLFKIEFTGVTLINKIIQVPGAQFHNMSSVHISLTFKNSFIDFSSNDTVTYLINLFF